MPGASTARPLSWLLPRGGKLEIVKLLIDKGADINAKDDIGQTVLIDAAWGGSLDVVKFLIDKGLDVNAGNQGGMTVLMGAAQGGKNLDVVKLLIDKGADTKARNHIGGTVLMCAARWWELGASKVPHPRKEPTSRTKTLMGLRFSRMLPGEAT